MSGPAGPFTPAPFLVGEGEMVVRMRQHDWSRTALGPARHWPQPLKTLVGLMLASRQPMFVAWGPGQVWLYNDASIPILGRKHPAALGAPALEVWGEARDALTPLFDRVFAGDAVQMDDIALMLDRHGRMEEAHFSFSYTPVRDEQGAVAGLFGTCIETTAQVLAERRQAAETERQRRMFEQAPGSICIMRGPDHVFEFINNAHRRLFNSADWLGKPVRAAFPGIAGQGYYELLDRVYATGERYVAKQAPFRYRRAPGEPEVERFLDFIYEPITDDAGHVTGIFCEGFDVSGTWRTEQALRESEEQLRLATEAAEIGLWDVDTVTDTLYWPPRVKAMFGISPDVPVSMADFYAGLHPDDRAATSAAYAAACDPERRSLYDVEYRTVGKEDGGVRWVAAKGRAVFDDSGRCVRVIGTAIDITARKAIEQRLHELNETLERRVEERTAERDRVWRNSRDLLVVVGTDGEFRAVNPAWSDVLGHDPAEVVGRRFLDFVWPADAAKTAAAFDTAVTERNPANFENRYRHKDGTPRWISWYTSVEGDLVFAYGRDITGEKEQQEALRIAEEQLRQSQKMEAVGQLTGGLAHDFNNLLTGIIGSLELLKTRVAQGRIKEIDRYVVAADGAAKRAAALTHRLLAFSRRQTLDPKSVQANRLVVGMEELVRRTIGPAIELEVVPADGLWTTFADPNQLENALLNLCINARDAMPDGGRLTIETENRRLDAWTARESSLEPGEYVAICVRDTGTGMTPDVMARAFDPFYTTKPIGMGTGLGLSMIYGFARQSGGQVRINSEIGRGTSVCIYLPRFEGRCEDGETTSELALAPRAQLGETVLVVDDERTVRMLVTDILEELGYGAIEAVDGASAMQILQSSARIDLLVTDVGLPGGMNGRQVADAARTLRAGLKVLFITGYAENAVIGSGDLEPGMQVLTKPFVVEDLATRIKELITSGTA